MGGGMRIGKKGTCRQGVWGRKRSPIPIRLSEQRARAPCLNPGVCVRVSCGGGKEGRKERGH